MSKLNESTAQPEQSSDIHLQTPHTLRLLRLIHDGTALHAREATKQLVHAVAPTLNVVQIWDLIGRLTIGLIYKSPTASSRWSSRVQVAQALQGVASYLPSSDQRDFLTSSSVDEISSGTDSSSLFLTIEEVHQSLPVILRDGRLLWGQSIQTFESDATDDDSDDATLHRFDQAGSRPASDRVQLQRMILASRLGLGNISQVLGISSVVPAEVLSAIDSADQKKREHQVSESKIPSQERNGKRGKSRKQQKKRRKFLFDDEIDCSKTGSHGALEAMTEAEPSSPSLSIRSLLVRQVNSIDQKPVSDHGTLSHRQPQTILATELVYRMFDATWSVRHGALLGTLALVRAWWRTSSTGLKLPQNEVVFGSWPQDILARAVCVLVLDRFSDFAGSIVRPHSDPSAEHYSPDLNQSTGGVVAPVRETAAQLTAVAFRMAPYDIQKSTLELLLKLSSHPGEWELRQGAMFALKFIAVMLSNPEFGYANESKIRSDCLCAVVRSATDRLADDSDEVVSVAAQILTRVYGSDPIQLLVNSDSNDGRAGIAADSTSLQEVASASLELLSRARPMSSYLIDAVTLFATIQGRESLHSSGEMAKFDSRVLAAVDILCDLLDSECESVRVAVIQSLSFLDRLTDMPDAAVLLGSSYTRAVQKIFSGYFCPSSCRTSCSSTELSSACGTWSSLAAASRLLAGTEAMPELEWNLIRPFFDSCSNEIPVGEAYERAIRCSRALAEMFAQSHISLVVDFCLRSYLHSPIPGQFECSCLLLQELISKKKDCVNSNDYLLICYKVFEEISDGSCTSRFLDASSTEIGTLRLTVAEAVTSNLRTILVGAGDLATWRSSVDRAEADLAKRRGAGPIFAECHEQDLVRLKAGVAGAIVAVSLPRRLTQIVRTLLTSMKNESCEYRIGSTTTYLADLCEKIGDDPLSIHSTARTKVLESVCDFVADNSSDITEGPLRLPSSSWILLLQRLASRLSLCTEVNSFPPLASAMSVLDTSLGDEALNRALCLLWAVCGGLMPASELSRSLVSRCMPRLANIACHHANPLIRTRSGTAALSLCALDRQTGLDRAIDAMEPDLANLADAHCRLRACLLVHELIAAADTAACPVVRRLLPIVLRLLADDSSECAHVANRLFAILVRLAPLIGKSTGEPSETPTSDDLSVSVVDHLILGKPLPSSPLPRVIRETLDNANVFIRPYQVRCTACVSHSISKFANPWTAGGNFLASVFAQCQLKWSPL
jgi:hypothetical protein